jgi:hypothetical protein
MSGEVVRATGASGAAPDSAGRRRVPPTPPFGGVVRAAISDFYFNSWRLVPANFAWTLTLVALILAALSWPPAVLLLPLLALPTAGIARMAALAARGEAVAFADFGGGIARTWRGALAAGYTGMALIVVFGTNLVVGMGLGGPAGWLFSAMAGYAAIGTAMVLVALWPILADPRREGWSLGRRLRLALLVNLARPGRMAGLTLVLAVLLAASTALFAVLVTAGVAFAILIATRYVLPIADALEGGAPATDPA